MNSVLGFCGCTHSHHSALQSLVVIAFKRCVLLLDVASVTSLRIKKLTLTKALKGIDRLKIANLVSSLKGVSVLKIGTLKERNLTRGNLTMVILACVSHNRRVKTLTKGWVL